VTHVAVMKIVMKEPHYLSDAVATLVVTRNVVINCPVKSRLSFCIFSYSSHCWAMQRCICCVCWC